MLNVSSQRRPCKQGKRKSPELMFSQLHPVPWGSTPLTCWLGDTWRPTELMQRPCLDQDRPVFVYAPGTVPDIRTAASSELFTDMARVLRDEPNTLFFPHWVHLFVFRQGSRRSPFFPCRSSQRLDTPCQGTAGPEALDSPGWAPQGVSMSKPHRMLI